MPTYRVFGELIQSFYTDVQAEDRIEAYDIANQRSLIDWFQVETDDVIEIINVEEYDQELGVPASGQLL